jgi:hypothetical protein
VKVRGARIEVGEIESRLLEHPAVREAVVEADGEASLAAYVVCSGETPSADLRAFLALRLPKPRRVPACSAPARGPPGRWTAGRLWRKVTRRQRRVPSACTPLEDVGGAFAEVLKVPRSAFTTTS